MKNAVFWDGTPCGMICWNGVLLLVTLQHYRESTGGDSEDAKAQILIDRDEPSMGSPERAVQCEKHMMRSLTETTSQRREKVAYSIICSSFN
jgi:hypothetical protein